MLQRVWGQRLLRYRTWHEQLRLRLELRADPYSGEVYYRDGQSGDAYAFPMALLGRLYLLHPVPDWCLRLVPVSGAAGTPAAAAVPAGSAEAAGSSSGPGEGGAAADPAAADPAAAGPAVAPSPAGPAGAAGAASGSSGFSYYYERVLPPPAMHVARFYRYYRSQPDDPSALDGSPAARRRQRLAAAAAAAGGPAAADAPKPVVESALVGKKPDAMGREAYKAAAADMTSPSPPYGYAMCAACGLDFATRQCFGQECHGYLYCYNCFGLYHPLDHPEYAKHWDVEVSSAVPVKPGGLPYPEEASLMEGQRPRKALSLTAMLLLQQRGGKRGSGSKGGRKSRSGSRHSNGGKSGEGEGDAGGEGSDDSGDDSSGDEGGGGAGGKGGRASSRAGGGGKKRGSRGAGAGKQRGTGGEGTAGSGMFRSVRAVFTRGSGRSGGEEEEDGGSPGSSRKRGLKRSGSFLGGLFGGRGDAEPSGREAMLGFKAAAARKEDDDADGDGEEEGAGGPSKGGGGAGRASLGKRGSDAARGKRPSSCGPGGRATGGGAGAADRRLSGMGSPAAARAARPSVRR
jgi:hypothetical protein